jgi:DNA replication protein DnaC
MLESVRSSIRSSDFLTAKEMAESLRDTEFWPEVLQAFESGQVLKCDKCGSEKHVKVNTKTLEIIDYCIICKEREIKEKEEKEFQRSKEFINLNVERILRKRGVPKIFLNAKITDFPLTIQKLNHTGKSLYLFGGRGRGKTHLAVAIMRQAILSLEPKKGNLDYFEISENRMPFFITIPDLLLLIRDTFRSSDEVSERQLIEKYSQIPLLVLDDLGAEKSSEWSIQTLYTIIDRRYREEMQTIFTSNLSLDELKDRLDDRITSRIIGMCKQPCELKGKDRRLEL